MRMSLGNAPKTYTQTFPPLTGGLNLTRPEHLLKPNESPDVRNLWWENGLLQCRPGQLKIMDAENLVAHQPSQDSGDHTIKACYSKLVHGHALFHWSNGIYSVRVDETHGGELDPSSLKLVWSDISAVNPGTFFQYMYDNTDSNITDVLYYKAPGLYIKIKFNDGVNPYFSADNMLTDAFVPTIIINASPRNGSGTKYMPENRLSPKKCVTYNVEYTESGTNVTWKANGTKTKFYFWTKYATSGNKDNYDVERDPTNNHAVVETVYVDGALLDASEYDVLENTAWDTSHAADEKSPFSVNLHTAPESGAYVVIHYHLVYRKYKLPVNQIDSVVMVKVGGVAQEEDTDYTVNLADGSINFLKGHVPCVADILTDANNNHVEITYSKMNRTARDAVMDCNLVTVAGKNSITILFAGCPQQPNAVFWNNRNDISMDPSYWPMDYYNLCGVTSDPITAFGQQYNDTIVLKEHSIGKLSSSVETVEGLNEISYTYETVNPNIGCDLPSSVQLVQNNLVFCNRSSGVHIMLSTSAALENNIKCISDKINGTEYENGLLEDVRAEDARVTSVDDGTRYWLGARGKVYLWDYTISTYTDPSWFYFTDIHGVRYFEGKDKKLYHFDLAGNLTEFAKNYYDYKGEIEKKYSFPAQYFGTYDLLKDVVSLLMSVRADTMTEIHMVYDTDYETREDLTPLVAGSWRLVPRNLNHRFLSVQKYAVVARRKPGCRHVRHFAVTLYNNEPGEDLAVISMQILYRFTAGKER